MYYCTSVYCSMFCTTEPPCTAVCTLLLYLRVIQYVICTTISPCNVVCTIYYCISVYCSIYYVLLHLRVLQYFTVLLHLCVLQYVLYSCTSVYCSMYCTTVPPCTADHTVKFNGLTKGLNLLYRESQPFRETEHK